MPCQPSTEVDGVRIVTIYAPNGRVVDSPFYHAKLGWFERLARWFTETRAPGEALVVLDLGLQHPVAEPAGARAVGLLRALVPRRPGLAPGPVNDLVGVVVVIQIGELPGRAPRQEELDALVQPGVVRPPPAEVVPAQ